MPKLIFSDLVDHLVIWSPYICLNDFITQIVFAWAYFIIQQMINFLKRTETELILGRFCEIYRSNSFIFIQLINEFIE